MIFDWAAFFVQAGGHNGAAPAGWPPHRDRMSDKSAQVGFRPDGSPRYVTFWMALTDATLETSCLMAVPRMHDPGYRGGDACSSPLDTVFRSPDRYQHIRPLPVDAGGLVAFSHRLLHWGSAAQPGAPAPRISIAFATADPLFEKPYLPQDALPVPSLEQRLGLIAAQTLIYSENEQTITTAGTGQMFYNMFSEYAHHFDTDFQESVRRLHAFKYEKLSQNEKS